MKTLKRLFRFIYLSAVSVVFGSSIYGLSMLFGVDSGSMKSAMSVLGEVPVRAADDIANMISEAALEYKISPVLVKAIVVAESGGKSNAIRHEEHHENRKDVRSVSKNQTEQYMYSSSIGLMQVMGWHATEYGLQWSDLLNPSTNLKVGADILSKCLAKQGSTKKIEKLRGALVCYNGSKEYPDKILETIGMMSIENMSL